MVTAPTGHIVTRFPRTEIEQSIAARFEGQAQQHPERLAVACGRDRLAYAELDGCANGAAQAVLDRLGAGEEPVGVLCGQGVQLVVAILGVLKAGKFYVPLDPSHPIERLRLAVGDSGARLVVTEERYAALAGVLGTATVRVGEGGGPRSPGGVRSLGRPDSPAYIYYTSGSTGPPKGVVDTQRNVLHNVMRYTNALAITPRDRLTLLQRPAFSGAVSSMFGALLNGAAVFPFDLDTEGAARLPDWLEASGITIYHSVPTIFRRLAAGGRRYSTVRVVRLEGDLATSRDVELFQRHFPEPAVLSHGLGATECGLVRRFEIGAGTRWPGGAVPIGYPVEDVDVSVVDEAARQLPPGEVGEIAVRSRYLALGYWKRPDLTAARFLGDEADPAIRTYLTGDLGRMSPDGCLEHLGRKDFQVIVGGTRVEVEAVENALVGSGYAREAAVTRRDGPDGGGRLVAFVVPAGATPTAGTLRRLLTAQVPRTSVPSEFLIADALPVNENGKIDRRALSGVEGRRAPLDADFARARDDVECALAALWEEVLGVHPVGVHDEFLDLGGDSLAATALLAAVEERFDRVLEPSILADGGTVERMARAIADSNGTAPPAPIVTLQRGAGLRPFFFAHGDVLGGGVYCAALARSLGTERPFHAIVPHGTHGDRLPPTLEAMAGERLQAVLRIDPQGPYLLGGHCMIGGLLAYELARQLEASGRNVDLVALLDTAPPAARAGIRPIERVILRVLDAVGRRGRLDIAGRLDVLMAMRRLVQACLRRTGMRDAASRALDELFIGHQTAAFRYVPGGLRARLVLLWPQENPVLPPAEAVNEWGRLASSITLTRVPGDHVTAVTRNVEVFARTLTAALLG